MTDAIPLSGWRVLVTRPRDQAAALIDKLQCLGATTVHWPAIIIAPPDDWFAVDEAIDHLGEFAWLIFSSANGVEFFFGRMKDRKRVADLGKIRIACVGPRTAAALDNYTLRADLVASDHSADGLLRTMSSDAVGTRVLIVRGDRGSARLGKELGKVAIVESIVAYRQIDSPADSAVFDMVSHGEIDAVLLSSSNIARSFVSRLDTAGRNLIAAGLTRLVAISPLTAGAIQSLGLPAAAVASEASDEGMVEALVQSKSRSAFQPR